MPWTPSPKCATRRRGCTTATFRQWVRRTPRSRRTWTRFRRPDGTSRALQDTQACPELAVDPVMTAHDGETCLREPADSARRIDQFPDAVHDVCSGRLNDEDVPPIHEQAVLVEGIRCHHAGPAEGRFDDRAQRETIEGVLGQRARPV